MKATTTNGQTSRLEAQTSQNINPTNMHGKVELITPERAARLLATSPGNRSVRPKRIVRYGDSMLEGRWVLHHQGIAIDENGRLRDGHHRLQAICDKSIPTVLFVVYNVPAASIRHVDEQLPRSIRDALRMAEEGDFSCSAIATANVFLSLPKEVTPNYDRDACIQILNDHSDSIAFAERFQGQGVTRGVRALIARAYYHHDHERLEEFGRTLVTGMPTSSEPQRDSAAITYRNFLLAPRGASPAIELLKYRKGQTCLQNFMAGKAMSKCYGTEDDLFPVAGRERGGE